MAWNQDAGVYYAKPNRSGWPDQRAIDNAWEVYNFFHSALGWTVESVAALAGNMTQESTLNPLVRAFTTSGAYGLTQLTTHKQDMKTWCQTYGYDYETGYGQCWYINYQKTNQHQADQWYATNAYPISFREFAENTPGYTVDQLSRAFNFCYERPGPTYNTDRTEYSEYYYNLYQGEPPGPGPDPPGPGPDPPGPTPGLNIPIYILQRKKPWWRSGGRKYINA